MDYWTNIFQHWAKTRGKNEQLESYEVPELNEALDNFAITYTNLDGYLLTLYCIERCLILSEKVLDGHSAEYLSGKLLPLKYCKSHYLRSQMPYHLPIHTAIARSKCSYLMLFNHGRILVIMTLFTASIQRSLEETT